ncbi:RDD family protein [Planobispora takensis]|uniref:RDD family protein n=1 Tax=Planobispora takensis TaxID=1367882 RepID=A0A8J3SQ60_9ACTN|nr:RDD family protein [Planobispora takensis]
MDLPRRPGEKNHPASAPLAPVGSYPVPIDVSVPPGVPVPRAEWWERLVARLIDGALFVALYWILSFAFYPVFAPAGEVRPADPRLLPGLFAGLVAFGAYTLYDYALHAGSGRTLGKKAMGIRLVPYGGGVPWLVGLAKRSVVFPGVLLVEGIPVLNVAMAVFGFVVGLSILLDKPLQRGLHDKAAGSVVVKDLR